MSSRGGPADADPRLPSAAAAPPPAPPSCRAIPSTCATLPIFYAIFMEEHACKVTVPDMHGNVVRKMKYRVGGWGRGGVRPLR